MDIITTSRVNWNTDFSAVSKGTAVFLNPATILYVEPISAPLQGGGTANMSRIYYPTIPPVDVWDPPAGLIIITIKTTTP